jgi:hypothetical protein
MRACLGCKTDISDRHGAAKRCVRCAPKVYVTAKRRKRTLAARYARALEEPTWRVEQLLAAAEARRKRIGRMTLTDAECWAGAGISTVYAEAGVGAEA